MAAGLPIVATRCGIEALVVHGEQALLVDVGDHEALALAIRSIGASATLATALGTSARRLASERYSIERTVRSYQSLYRELAACAYPARV
jgi:glycosyltransferase involved in cell wall biosynthesis